MATKYRVIKVKGAEPESFMVVGIDFDQHAITRTSNAMSEVDMRTYLKKEGGSDAEVNTWIEQARRYPE